MPPRLTLCQYWSAFALSVKSSREAVLHFARNCGSRRLTLPRIGRSAFAVLFLCLMATACRQPSRDDLLAEGASLLQAGNVKGAVVVYKTLVERSADDAQARFALAGAYQRMGKPDNAENELRKLAASGVVPEDFHLLMGRILLDKNLPARAMNEFQAQIALTPQNAHALEGLGLALLWQQNAPQAIDVLEQALALDPNLPLARQSLVEIWLNQPQFDRAEQEVKELLSRHPGHQYGMHLLARLQAAQGHPVQAAETYAAVRSKHPNDVDARSQEALLRLSALDDKKFAAATAQSLVSGYPQRPEGYRLQGLVAFQNDDFKLAISSFQQALKLSPDPTTNMLLAQSHAANGDPETAVSELSRVLDQSPQNIQARLSLANLHLRLNRTDAAIAELEKLLQFYPDNAQGKALLGEALFTRGDVDKSLALFTDLDARQGGNVENVLRKGILLAAKGQTAQAEAALRQAVAIDPGDMNARLVLSTFCKLQGRIEDAMAALDVTDEDPTKQALAYNAKAQIRLQQERLEETRSLLAQAQNVNPDLAVTYHNLAQLAFQTGNAEEAIVWHRQFLAKHPDDVDANIALALNLEYVGQIDEALAALTLAAKTNSAKGYLQLAAFLLRRDQSAQALQALDACLAAHKGNQPALIVKARLSATAGDDAGAEAAWLELDRQDKTTAFAERFRAALMGRRWEAAETLAKNYIAAAPNEAARYLPLANLRETQGDRAAAQEVLRQAVAADGGNAQLQASLALLSHKSGKSQEARDRLSEAITKEPNTAVLYTTRGIVRQALGDAAGSMADYEQALRLKPQDLTALNNLAELCIANQQMAARALKLSLAAYYLAPDNPSVLDTLGMSLLQNNRLDAATRMLTRAVALAPKDQEIVRHLQQAKESLLHHGSMAKSTGE